MTTRSYGGESQEARQAKRRARFLLAGRQVFGTVGYRKATVRSLCREAALTDRYFYESFKSIEALLVAVYSELIVALQNDILQAISALEPGASVDQVIHTGLNAFFSKTEDPELARIVYIEILSVGVGDASEAVYNVTLRGFAEFFYTLAKAQLPQMQVDDELGEVLAMGIIGAISESAKNWLLGGYAQPKTVMVEAMEIMVRGLVQQMTILR